MPRKKVNIEYITDETKRNKAFKKREKGLIKKIDEISTLCGIEACAIIFNPDYPHQAKVWPSEIGAENVLSRFRAMPEVDQTRKMLDQESILKQRILKAQEQLQKQRDDNKEKEMTLRMLQCMHSSHIVENMSMTDLNSLSSLIDDNLKKVEQKLDGMQAQEVVQNVGAQITSFRGDQQNIGRAQGLMIRVGERRNMGHAQGIETNMDVIESDQPWSMDFTNNIDGVLPFELNPELP